MNGALTGPASLTVLSTTLPGSVTTSVSPSTINNGGSATVSVGNLAGVARGTYTITIRASAGGNTETLDLQLIIEGIPAVVTLLEPIDGAVVDRNQPVDFDWTDSPEANQYLISLMPTRTLAVLILVFLPFLRLNLTLASTVAAHKPFTGA